MIQKCVHITDRNIHCEVFGINTDIIYILSISFIVISLITLLVNYLVYVVIEGFEKPKFINAKNKKT